MDSTVIDIFMFINIMVLVAYIPAIIGIYSYDAMMEYMDIKYNQFLQRELDIMNSINSTMENDNVNSSNFGKSEINV